ncbi:unnamed protein product [Amoebophrya sp. A25]|nr:unnamed protein product [Amoebophrya sp. A25]|eukprot:GSA25T00004021001.1
MVEFDGASDKTHVPHASDSATTTSENKLRSPDIKQPSGTTTMTSTIAPAPPPPPSPTSNSTFSQLGRSPPGAPPIPKPPSTKNSPANTSHVQKAPTPAKNSPKQEDHSTSSSTTEFFFEEEGSLGIEFEDFVHPFRVIDLHDGLCKKLFEDTFPVPGVLVSINGKTISSETDWDNDLVPQITSRPLRIVVEKEENQASRVVSGLFSSFSSAAQNAASLAKDSYRIAKDSAQTAATLATSAPENVKSAAAKNLEKVSGKVPEQLTHTASVLSGAFHFLQPDDSPTDEDQSERLQRYSAIAKLGGGESSATGSQSNASSTFKPESRFGAAARPPPASPDLALLASPPRAKIAADENKTAEGRPTDSSAASSSSSSSSTDLAGSLRKTLLDGDEKSGDAEGGNQTSSKTQSTSPKPDAAHDQDNSSPSNRTTSYHEYTAMLVDDGPLGLEFSLEKAEKSEGSGSTSSKASAAADSRGLDRELPRVFVRHVDPSSSSQKSGVRPGDELLKVDGQQVAFESVHAVQAVLESLRPVQCSFRRAKPRASTMKKVSSPELLEQQQLEGATTRSTRSSTNAAVADTEMKSPPSSTIRTVAGPPGGSGSPGISSKRSPKGTNKGGSSPNYAGRSPSTSKQGLAPSSKSTTSSMTSRSGSKIHAQQKEVPEVDANAPMLISPSSSAVGTKINLQSPLGQTSGSARSSSSSSSTSKAEKSSDDQNKNNEDLEKRVEELKLMSSHWEEQARGGHAKLVTLTGEYNSLVTAHEELEGELDELRSRVGELEDYNIKWQQRHDKQGREMERLKNWVNEHKPDAHELKEAREAATRVAALETELQELRTAQTDLQNRNTEVQKALEHEQGINKKLQLTIDTVQGDHGSEIDRLEASLAQANKQKRTFQSQISELEESLQKRRVTQTQESERLNSEKSRVDELEKELAKVRESCTALIGERDHFSKLVDQCFEKMKRESEDRIFQVDRRVVCDSLTQYCKVDRVLGRSLFEGVLHITGSGARQYRPKMEAIEEENHTQKQEILSRLADSLGFSADEREQVGLNRSHLFHALRNEGSAAHLNSPDTGRRLMRQKEGRASTASKGSGLGSQFVDYLEQEVADDDDENK